MIVDNFAGGGGASTGIELAIGRPVDIAINHDPDAILMHRTNHPNTSHLQASVWDVDPVQVCNGYPVGLAWFSPDCKHFSKAKGSSLVDRNIRALAWIVLRWAAKVRPSVIILENVEEFKTWGPVKKGKPIKSKAGETYMKWWKQLHGLGYEIDSRELIAADYGAPTSRKRFVLIARCDGRPIVWPNATHNQDGFDGLKKWRSAAEVIDWSLPCYSIFATRDDIKKQYGVNALRPLADNTLRRVMRGVDKFLIKSDKPFIVQSSKSSLAPVLIQYHSERSSECRANRLNEPLRTVDSSNRYGLVCANLIEYYGNSTDVNLREPMRTITTRIREAVILSNLVEYTGKTDQTEHWSDIRNLLNKYCEYNLTDNDILLLEINGKQYYIADIGLRMLSPRELYDAMGFPPDYIIDHDYQGNAYGKAKQVARCGNAVSPMMAEAVVRANL